MSDQQEIPISTPPTEPLKPDQNETLTQVIGAKLERARQATGKSIDTVMHELKLKRNYIEALESGNWNSLPDRTYGMGFLRQYAKHLNLNLETEFSQLRDEQYKLTKPLTYPDPPIAPPKKWAVIAAAAFVVLLIIFSVFNSNEHIDTAKTVPEPEATSQTQPVLPVSPAVIEPVESSAATVPVTGAMSGATAVPASKDPIPAKAAIGSESATATLTSHKAVLDVSGSMAWMEIYLPDATGKQIGKLDQKTLLKAGQPITVEFSGDALFITCGNAGVLRVTIDGKTVAEAGSLGRVGEVIRKHRFDAPVAGGQ